MKRIIYFIAVVFLIAALTGCFSPWAAGSISISLGVPSNSRFFIDQEIDLPEFEHIITLRGPGGTVTKTLGKGELSAVFEVAPGKWTIDVRAIGNSPSIVDDHPDLGFPKRMLRALAIEPDIEITQGVNAKVNVFMRPAVEVDNLDQLDFALSEAEWGEIFVLKKNMDIDAKHGEIGIGYLYEAGQYFEPRSQYIIFIADTDIVIKKELNFSQNIFLIQCYSTLQLGIPGMTGTITFDGNSANLAGSTSRSPIISIDSGSLFMSDGVILTNNYADRGGAVIVGNSDNYAFFRMDGGIITGNRANSDGIVGGGVGGGVYVENGAEFFMTGGIIRSNTATYSGGGVYVNDGIFHKESYGGIIYGQDEGINSNILTSTQIGFGFAVCYEADFMGDTGPLAILAQRNRTIRANDEIFTSHVLNPDHWDVIF